MNVSLDIIEEDTTVTLEIFEGSAPGLNGKSAYQDWIDLGNVGSVQDFLDSQKGEKGEKGDKGNKGDKGEKGDKGDAFEYPDFTETQIENLKARVILPQLTFDNLPTKENKIYYTY